METIGTLSGLLQFTTSQIAPTSTDSFGQSALGSSLKFQSLAFSLGFGSSRS